MFFSLYDLVVMFAPPCSSAHLYAALCEDVAKLMKRAINLYQKYSTKLYAEESYDRENLEQVSFVNRVTIPHCCIVRKDKFNILFFPLFVIATTLD